MGCDGRCFNKFEHMVTKNVIGYEGFYTINDSGIDDKTVYSVRSGRYLHPTTINTDGYKRVVLKVNGTKKNCSLHHI